MMSWFKAHPFESALILSALALLAVGGGIVFSEAVRLDEQRSTVDQKSAQLQKLQSNKPFPDSANVDATKREVAEARSMLEELSKGLAVETPSASPQSFQDQLAKLVKDVSEKAAGKGIGLPEKFYLGFEKYETQLPSADIAPTLATQLRTIHAVVSVLLDAQAKSVGPILRAPLVGEESPPTDGKTSREASQAESGTSGLEVATFDISFVADQPALRLAFNRLNDIEPPVFVRLVAIENSSPTPPSKTQEPADTTAELQAQQDQQPTAAASTIKPVVGRETLTVSLKLASVVHSDTAEPKQR